MATKTAVIKIDLQVEGGQRLALSVGNLKELREAIKQINAQKITLDPRSPQFATASNQLKTLSTLYKGLSKDADNAEQQISEANRALNQQPKAVGYYRQLQAQLVATKNEFKDLSKAEAQGLRGQRLASNIRNISDELKRVDAQFGDFQRNVGNYRQAAIGIGDVLTGGLVSGGVVAGVGLLTSAMLAGTNQAIAYEKALDNLSALTGLEGAGLENLDRLARQLQNIQVEGEEIVNTGPEILNALKLVGGARPELLGDAEALAEVTKQAIILSKASGDDLASSVNALTTIMGQFKLSAQDTTLLINELAAGAKEGSAEIPQITDSLREFGTVAEISNVTTSESIALIELLADRQLKGAEAGTQLRNIFSKLASADVLPKNAQKQFERLGIDINVLKDSTLPLETRLRELGKAENDVAALTKIFGLENLQAATIITSGIPKYVALNEAVQGTNEAYRQAAVNADNVATKIDNLKKNSLNGLEKQFTDTANAGGTLLDVFNFLVRDADLIGAAFSAMVGPINTVIKGIKDTGKILGIGGSTGVGAAYDKAASDVQRLTGEVNALGDALAKAPGNEVLKATAELGKKRKELVEAEKELARLEKVRAELRGGAIKEAEQPVAEFSLADPLFPDFKTTSFEEATQAAVSSVEEIGEAVDKDTEKKRKNKEENLGAADSVARLRREVQLLQDALARSPSDQVYAATLKLVEAEKRLAEAEGKLSESRIKARRELAGPFDPNTVLRRASASTETAESAEAGALELGVKIDTKENEAEGKRQLEKLADELAKSVGVEIPVDVNTDEAEKIFRIQRYFRDQENAAREKDSEEERERQEKRLQQQQEFYQLGIDAANQFNAQLAASEQARVENQLARETEAINAEYDQKKAAAQGNAQILASLEKKRQAEILEAEKKAARERQGIARKEAAIQYAVALAASGGNPFKIAAATIAFALALAAINAQEFWRGGTVKDLQNEQGVVKSPNMKPTKRGDNRVAYLKVGERVLTKDNQREMEARFGADVWRKVGAKDPNSIFGARGAISPNASFGAGRQVLNVSTSLSRDDIGSLSRAVAQTNSNMAQVVREAMIEGAKYARREERAMKKAT